MEDKTTRQDRIDTLRVVDNVGWLDGLDLENMSEEDFTKLEDEVFDDASERAKSWERQFTRGKEG